MLSERLNIYEYEEVLMGQRMTFESSFRGTQRENQIEVGNIWRYAVTKLLRWTPQQAVIYLDSRLVMLLCLDKTFHALGFRPKNGRIENQWMWNYSYFLQFAFPGEIVFDERAEAIDEYKHVAHIQEYAFDGQHPYPKKMFCGEFGQSRARMIMRYALDLYLRGSMSISDQYEFFKDRKTAKKWLNSKMLLQPLTKVYRSPLDYFHDALPLECKDEFLYFAYVIEDLYKQKIKALENDRKKTEQKRKEEVLSEELVPV